MYPSYHCGNKEVNYLNKRLKRIVLAQSLESGGSYRRQNYIIHHPNSEKVILDNIESYIEPPGRFGLSFFVGQYPNTTS